MDRDGDLDLWIGNYVDADRTHSPFCGNARLGVRFYCNPLKYDPLPSHRLPQRGRRLHRCERRVWCRMGIDTGDYDGDGRLDLVPFAR